MRTPDLHLHLDANCVLSVVAGPRFEPAPRRKLVCYKAILAERAVKSKMYLLVPSQYEPFEIGATLIAILAFPGCYETNARRQAFEALCAHVVRATCEAEPEKATEWSERFPAYAAIDAKESRRRLRTLRRRLRDRMVAARMALGYFDEALRHMFASIGEAYPDLKPEIGGVELRPTPFPDGLARHSVNALMEYHFPHSNEEGRHNREHRMWHSSLPVIHLAVAFHVLGRHLQSGAETFAYKLDDLDLHRRVLALAEVHETAAHCEWERREAGSEGSSTFMIDPNVLVRCRTENLTAQSF